MQNTKTALLFKFKTWSGTQKSLKLHDLWSQMKCFIRDFKDLREFALTIDLLCFALLCFALLCFALL